MHDLDDPALAGLTRAARYDTLLGLAAANLRTGRPVALDATQPTPAQVQAVLAHLSR